MRIIGYGIDVVKIADIKDEVDSTNKRWTEQFCSADERAHAGTAPARYRYYASCFAAKEAVVKALGSGFAGDITWRGIEILRQDSGAPYIRLRDEVLELAASMGITDWLINVSGFHVDPGYKNTLKFAVYNAGPQSIYLDQGQPMFLIWYAALDQVTEDLYTPRPGLSKNITAEDVKRIAGDVASPAELKKQLDDIKADYDKRLLSVELSEKLLRWLVGALILLLVGTMLRAGWFDARSESKARLSTAPSQAKQDVGQEQPRTKDGAKLPPERNAIELPHDQINDIVHYASYRLGLWILGGAAMVSVSILVSAVIIRGRSNTQTR